MTSIDLRFARGRLPGADALDGWIDAPGDAGSSAVHGVDLTAVSRPRAVRAVVHQRMTLLQLGLIRLPSVRRILIVMRLREECDIERACAGIAASAASVHHRVENARGTAFGIAVLAAPESAPARDVRRIVSQGAATVPDGAACVSWDEAREWGLRAAVSLQTL